MPAAPRPRRPPRAALSEARASAGRPATRSSSTARSSASTRRPAPACRPTRWPAAPIANARRIVAFGTRNPFRFTIRPSTNEVWLGDVGWNDYEEINRIADPTSSPVANLGWPCFEGNGQQSAFAAAGLDSCASLYQAPTGLLSPYFAYAHSATVVPGETCPTGSSAIAGMAFYQGGPYPAAYDGTLFFADHSRNCIWAMHQGSNGLPDPTQVETFVAGAANPVDLETGPNGDLFYVDFDGGTIHRVVFGGSNLAPTAVIKATPSSGPSPLTVALDGTDSTDPEGRALTYSWDLDNDGTFGDSTSATPTVTFPTSGTHTVRLQVTDPSLATGTTSFDVLVDDSLPHPVIDTPGRVADLAGRPDDLVQRSRDGRPGCGDPGQRSVVDARPPPLSVQLSHPYGPVVQRRRERVVRRAGPRLPVVPRAGPDGDGLERPQDDASASASIRGRST